LLGVPRLLLIACANIANLLLARSARAPERWIRLSIGAKPSALNGQLLTESLYAAVLGGMGPGRALRSCSSPRCYALKCSTRYIQLSGRFILSESA